MSNPNLLHMSDHWWTLLDQFATLATLSVMLINLLLISLAYLKRDKIRLWFRRNHYPNLGQEIDKAWDAFAFTVSKPDIPMWVIDQYKPQAIALVASRQSMHFAEQIREYAEKQGCKVWLADAVSADDTAQAKIAVKQILRELMQNGCADIAVDVTGGKIPMSLGAFMAAEEMLVDSLYVSAEYDPELKAPKIQSIRPIVVSPQ